MTYNEMHFYRKTAVFWTDGSLPKKKKEIASSNSFALVVSKFLEYLRQHESPFLNLFPKKLPETEQDKYMLSLLRHLSENSKSKVLKNYPKFKHTLSETHLLQQFVEELYNFWRSHERYLVCISHTETQFDKKKPKKTFRGVVNRINSLVRKVYRNTCENITGSQPRIYRQVPAGFQVGLIAMRKSWHCPEHYNNVHKIPFITQALMYPPLIIDPPTNKRTGEFKKVVSNPLEGIEFKEGEWLCYPAKVADLLVHVYFCNKFISLGCALANLFELADKKELHKKPDAIYAFGVPENSLDKFGEMPTIFYDDHKNNLLIAAVPCNDEFGYFGYLKKMILTLHNIIMMKRGRLPVHGAMVNVTLKNSASANIIFVGDTGAGKSESIEAFRVLGEKHIRSMTIIFDDMGSLDIKDGKIKAYGTEVGAFVRLDDLHPGYAFGNIDRSIIMSPQKINARAVIPVTTLRDVCHGYPVNYFLYANNYEEIDNVHPHLEKFKSAEEAISVFREGAVMSKGTTSSVGLVHTYFANIFGPAQYKEIHEKLAKKYFKALFENKTFVGQIRTRLGIPGFETKGPESAAEALFKIISEQGNK